MIEGRSGTVFVNDVRLDEITTRPFPKQTVPNEQYFLLGDNRSAAIDSRTFGPVLGNAIYAKVFAVDWPLRTSRSVWTRPPAPRQAPSPATDPLWRTPCDTPRLRL